MVTRGAVYDHNREKLLVASSGLEEVITIRMVRCLQRPPDALWGGLVDLPVYIKGVGLPYWIL